MEDIVIFWFRRDLRLEDNAGLWHALNSGYKVLPLFIYDKNILEKLERDDIRMGFLKTLLSNLNSTLRKARSSLITISGIPFDAFRELNGRYRIKAIYFNRDYEPYALKRDKEISDYFSSKGIAVYGFKDHVIFEMTEVVKDDGKPYTIFTPYSRKWMSLFSTELIKPFASGEIMNRFVPLSVDHFITPDKIGFACPEVRVKSPILDEDHISQYARRRDIPAEAGTSFLGPHLRFGTISIREVLGKTLDVSSSFKNELIWREFFMQILYHFPQVTDKSFRPQYDRILWINNEEQFRKWCEGKTGFPIVDAGMRELNQTGYMHNRVRMIVANFLTRHLLTDWRWGEAWFASKLLDFELSSNNGNWQWAAGTGCDAAPYFRVFNPQTQAEKFDPDNRYIKKWVPEYGTPDYPAPCVDHADARQRAMEFYKRGINS